jgi:heparan-alpha-glucosaminide N-acetyltransferase
LLCAGLGLVGLASCYVFVDIYKVWTGAPFLYMGMNSILFYCAHEIFEEYMPFGYNVKTVEHGPELLSDVIGVSAWVALAYYCWTIKFFVKV